MDRLAIDLVGNLDLTGRLQRTSTRPVAQPSCAFLRGGVRLHLLDVERLSGIASFRPYGRDVTPSDIDRVVKMYEALSREEQDYVYRQMRKELAQRVARQACDPRSDGGERE